MFQRHWSPTNVMKGGDHCLLFSGFPVWAGAGHPPAANPDSAAGCGMFSAMCIWGTEGVWCAKGWETERGCEHIEVAEVVRAMVRGVIFEYFALVKAYGYKFFSLQNSFLFNSVETWNILSLTFYYVKHFNTLKFCSPEITALYNCRIQRQLCGEHLAREATISDIVPVDYVYF